MAHLDRFEVEVAEVDEMGGEVSDVASSSAGTSWYSGAPHITATAASSRSMRRNSLTSVPDDPPSLLWKLNFVHSGKYNTCSSSNFEQMV